MADDTRRFGARVDAALGAPPRRVLLTGLGAAALASLVDRGLRLDLPQPPPPVPRRRLAVDERVLLGEVADLRELVAAESSLTGAGRVVPLVRDVQASQLAVLTGRLTNQGVPSAVIAAARPPSGSPAPATTPSTAPTPTTPATSPTVSDEVPTTVAALAARLADVPDPRWSALAAASPATRSLLLAAHSARFAGARLLGAELALDTSPSPVRAALAARTQPLVYAFEVVAAQSRDDVRARAEATLAALQRLSLAVAVPGASLPGGWALPFPVTTPAGAARLARTTLRAAADAVGSVVGSAPATASLADAARWGGNVQALATGWGVPLRPFPGTSA